MSPDRKIVKIREWARRIAVIYRRSGLIPLPAQVLQKRPALGSYRGFRKDVPLPDQWFRKDGWWTPNIQLFTGRTQGSVNLVVVDLDGIEARAEWERLVRLNKIPQRNVWICASPSGGRHWYFRAPPDMEVATRLVWAVEENGTWAKHKEIRILGEGGMVMAPPSIHPKHRSEGLAGRYRFEPGWGPDEHPVLSMAPDWLLAMPGLPGCPQVVAPVVRLAGGSTAPAIQQNGQIPKLSRDQVLSRISPESKLELAVSWGLRLGKKGEKPTPEGWVECHAIDREDKHPSAGLNVESGVYHDRGAGYSLSFFDLAVRLGAYTSWLDAKKDLMQRAFFGELTPRQEPLTLTHRPI